MTFEPGPTTEPHAPPTGARIAVLIPCFNEELPIAGVIDAFRTALPDSCVFVYDNNSTDRTAEKAREAGAIVRQEPYQGKGNVVRRMFADVDADYYLMVDGDGTYDAQAAPALLQKLISDNLDLVCGARQSTKDLTLRRGHAFGNLMLTSLVGLIFGHGFRDMLTGYRVMSRRFVKSFPAASRGFEIETELTVYALQMRLRTAEIPTAYFARPAGSSSKLNTIRDGIIILQMIGLLVKEEKPFTFFSLAAGLFAATSVFFAIPVLIEYSATGLVPRFPTLFVSVGAAVVSVLLFCCGLILDTVSRGRQESRRLAYLNAGTTWGPTQWRGQNFLAVKGKSDHEYDSAGASGD
jgi:glycosyltransferase involved in cell wall biosynthesis